MGFMSELCFCSHKELITVLPRNKGAAKKSAAAAAVTLSVHSRLLYPRLVDVMLKCVRSGRPMIHLVMAWAIVGPHLMEVSRRMLSKEHRVRGQGRGSPYATVCWVHQH